MHFLIILHMILSWQQIDPPLTSWQGFFIYQEKGKEKQIPLNIEFQDHPEYSLFGIMQIGELKNQNRLIVTGHQFADGSIELFNYQSMDFTIDEKSLNFQKILLYKPSEHRLQGHWHLNHRSIPDGLHGEIRLKQMPVLAKS